MDPQLPKQDRPLRPEPRHPPWLPLLLAGLSQARWSDPSRAFCSSLLSVLVRHIRRRVILLCRCRVAVLRTVQLCSIIIVDPVHDVRETVSPNVVHAIDSKIGVVHGRDYSQLRWASPDYANG